ncbi:TonB-dependent receptor [Candidatus Sulfopaludibacter sp. SbA3]|nr:TonB-dependent receptor [Candidatus Sulfopaludibacter sp. SbA3]
MRRSDFHLRIRLGFVPILVTALLTAIAPFGAAQEVTAAITGKIADPSGSAVAGAAVTAKDMERGTAWPTKTNEEGVYTLPRLPIGRYEVRVEAPGFQVAVHPAFDLQINQTARIDIALTIGNVSQSVEVSSAAPLLQTETTQLGGVMEAHTISSLPLETRNYNQLALLMPGSVATSPGSFNSPQATFNSGRPNINGNREQANYYLLDGMDNNEFVDNNVAYSPNVDAIQEFAVITNNPSAEFGHFLGGVINASLKSGTKQFHGDAFEYLRNDFFNANEWSRNFSTDPTVNSAPQGQHWNQFGGTLGGPIKREKLFFFVDYQGSRFDTPASPSTFTTFTGLNRTGNLSDIAGLQLNYPGTTVPLPSNLTQAAICTGGQKMGINPCINGISPTALKIMNVLPAPTLPGTNNGTLNNAANTQQTYTHGSQGDVKMDWSPTQQDHFYARYSQQHIEQPTLNSQALLYNGSGNNSFPLQSSVLDYTRSFGPTLVNDARIGFNYYPAEANTQTAAATNAGGLIAGQPTAFLPGMYFAGSPVGGSQNGPFPFGTTDSPEIFHQTAIQYSDTAIWTRGTHAFHFGFQLIRYRNNYVPATSSDGAAGQIGFSGAYTGSSEADFLLGLPSYIAYGQGFSGTVGQRNDAFGAFAQDDWRVNKRLTINIGLRWQVFTPIYEVHDRMTNFNEYTGQIELAGQNGNSRALYNQYNGIANFLPRLGLAWTPWDDKTVIRAAFSRSSFQEGTGEYNRLATNAPWNVDLVGQFAAGTHGAIPSNQITLDQGFAGLGSLGGTPCNPSTVLSVPASCFSGVRIHATDPNYRPAVSNQWNVTVERQLANSTMLQASYVGQHTDHMAAIYNMGQNVLEPNGTSIPGPYLAGNQALVNAGTGQKRLNTSVGIQNYDALQITAMQRLTKGLAFQFNYTWQKCLTNNQGYYGRYGDAQASQASADVSFQEYVYNTRLDYGLCDRDVTSVFTGYANYDLPFGHNRMFAKNAPKAVNAAIGDWQFNTILTLHGGFPVSMLDYSADPTGAYFQPRPDCIAPSVATPFKNYEGGGYIWFDPTTMRDPATGKLGNCPISSERGPGLRQIDMSLSKKFMLTEHQSLEFRFDSINAFNTPIFTVQGYQIDIFSNSYSLLGSGSNVQRNPSGLTGVVNSSLGARNLQFALKWNF